MGAETAIASLRVWHNPQVPGQSFYVSVKNIEQAKFVIKMLAEYDQFQFDIRIKPDYCNASGLEVFEDNDWVEWSSDDGDCIDDLMRGEEYGR